MEIIRLESTLPSIKVVGMDGGGKTLGNWMYFQGRGNRNWMYFQGRGFAEEFDSGYERKRNEGKFKDFFLISRECDPSTFNSIEQRI